MKLHINNMEKSVNKINELHSDSDDDNEHPFVSEKKGFTVLTVSSVRSLEKDNGYIDDDSDDDEHLKIHEAKHFLNIKNHVSLVDTTANEKHSIAFTSSQSIQEKKENIVSLKTIKNEQSIVICPRLMIGSNEQNRTSDAHTELTPEEEYLQQLERIIDANALSPRNMKILKQLYAQCKHNEEKPLVQNSNVIYDASHAAQSALQNKTLIEHGTTKNEENNKDMLNEIKKTDSESSHTVRFKNIGRTFVQLPTIAELKKEATTSTASETGLQRIQERPITAQSELEFTTRSPRINVKLHKEIHGASSQFQSPTSVINNTCNVDNLVIKSPFSDFSLQGVRLKTGLQKLDVINKKCLIDEEHANNPGFSTRFERNLNNVKTDFVEEEEVKMDINSIYSSSSLDSYIENEEDIDDKRGLIKRIQNYFFVARSGYFVPRQKIINLKKITVKFVYVHVIPKFEM